MCADLSSGIHDLDPSAEIRAILARGGAGGSSGKLVSSIFGCSPPVRTGDPVVRDSGFSASHTSKCVESLFRNFSTSMVRATCREPGAARRVEGFRVKQQQDGSDIVS